MQKCGVNACPKAHTGTMQEKPKLMEGIRQYPLGDVQWGKWRKPPLDDTGQMTLGSKLGRK